MKGVTAVQLEQRFLTRNPCFTSGRTIKPKGIMVHSLGVAQPDPNVFIRQWDTPQAKIGVHAIVGCERVFQLLPWTRRGWHAGTGAKGLSANNTHISFEICEPSGHTYQGGTMIGYDTAKNAAYFTAVYQNAVELAALLCQSFGFDPISCIICHSEGYKQGIASNHADVMHWFPKHGKSMDTFRADVKEYLEEEAMDQTKFNGFYNVVNPLYTSLEQVPDYWRADAEKLVKAGAIKGDGIHPICIRQEQLQAVIVAMRYTDAIAY